MSVRPVYWPVSDHAVSPCRIRKICNVFHLALTTASWLPQHAAELPVKRFLSVCRAVRRGRSLTRLQKPVDQFTGQAVHVGFADLHPAQQIERRCTPASLVGFNDRHGMAFFRVRSDKRAGRIGGVYAPHQLPDDLRVIPLRHVQIFGLNDRATKQALGGCNTWVALRIHLYRRGLRRERRDSPKTPPRFDDARSRAHRLCGAARSVEVTLASVVCESAT